MSHKSRFVVKGKDASELANKAAEVIKNNPQENITDSFQLKPMENKDYLVDAHSTSGLLTDSYVHVYVEPQKNGETYVTINAHDHVKDVAEKVENSLKKG